MKSPIIKAERKPGNSILNGIQTGLDIIGLIPVVGEIADGINAIIYAARGDYINAALSAVAMVPFAGIAATGGKITRKAIQYTAKARTAERGLELGGRFLKEGYTEIAPGVYRSSDGLRQFRMTDADITGRHGGGPHFNFETLNSKGIVIKNGHMPIK
jgi:hypothetical protein